MQCYLLEIQDQQGKESEINSRPTGKNKIKNRKSQRYNFKVMEKENKAYKMIFFMLKKMLR